MLNELKIIRRNHQLENYNLKSQNYRNKAAKILLTFGPPLESKQFQQSKPIITKQPRVIQLPQKGKNFNFVFIGSFDISSQLFHPHRNYSKSQVDSYQHRSSSLSITRGQEEIPPKCSYVILFDQHVHRYFRCTEPNYINFHTTHKIAGRMLSRRRSESLATLYKY